MEKILVVKRNDLFKEKYFEGFIEWSEYDFIKTILKNYEFKLREKIEKNENYKQPIPYGVIINKQKKEVFLYERGTKEYKEKRLAKKLSIGIGGHVNKNDFNKKNTFLETLKREILEEIYFKSVGYINLFGYINDDSDNVGKVHFGIVYLIHMNKKIFPKKGEIEWGEMKNIEEILNMLKNKENFENWSKILIKPLYDFLK